jgi:hypothetical protein
MIESPVPYLIGILGNQNLMKKLMANPSIHHCEFVMITNKKIELCVCIY